MPWRDVWNSFVRRGYDSKILKCQNSILLKFSKVFPTGLGSAYLALRVREQNFWEKALCAPSSLSQEESGLHRGSDTKVQLPWGGSLSPTEDKFSQNGKLTVVDPWLWLHFWCLSQPCLHPRRLLHEPLATSTRLPICWPGQP